MRDRVPRKCFAYGVPDAELDASGDAEILAQRRTDALLRSLLASDFNRRAIKKSVLSAIAACADDESRFISNARQLIYEGKRSGEGYFSPDGGKLVFHGKPAAMPMRSRTM